MSAVAVDWSIRGSYFESCNCDAICPCRTIGEKPGGRSTYGECVFALSWLVRDGSADGIDLSGLAAVLTGRYHDDEPGSPWTFFLHVDERGSDDQQRLLADILLGKLGGEHIENLPWVRKPSELLGVRSSKIEVDHTPRKQWLRAGTATTVRVSGPMESPEQVTCGIPGHERHGEELVVEVLQLDDGPLQFEFEGNCAYAADFDYSS